MKLTKVISPVLEKELREIAGMNDGEVELYMSLLTQKSLKKKRLFTYAWRYMLQYQLYK